MGGAGRGCAGGSRRQPSPPAHRLAGDLKRAGAAGCPQCSTMSTPAKRRCCGPSGSLDSSFQKRLKKISIEGNIGERGGGGGGGDGMPQDRGALRRCGEGRGRGNPPAAPLTPRDGGKGTFGGLTKTQAPAGGLPLPPSRVPTPLGTFGNRRHGGGEGPRRPQQPPCPRAARWPLQRGHGAR